MSTEYKVVVEGGGRNLYKVTEYRGTYHVYHVKVGILGDSQSSVGKGDSLEVALTLIRSHSSEEIEKVVEVS